MKWALIMGASGDLGSQIANDLSAAGWSLYLHYHQNNEKITKLAKNLQHRYPHQDFLVVHYDMCDSKNITQLTSQLFSVDAVIFAEGTTQYGLFVESDLRQFDAMMTMQITTPLAIIQQLQEKLSHSNCGRIVFIGSVYGGVGSAMEVGYSTIKGAMSAFVNAYSREVATLGITVNVVAPGAVDTQMNAMFSDDMNVDVAAQIPTQRFAMPSEVSYWVLSLLKPQASYLTGQTLYVSGGWLK